MRRTLHLVRQTRGRKRFCAPRDASYNLDPMFEDLNFRYFHGLMARPALGWGLAPRAPLWAITTLRTTPSC